jgi:uncharacterized cupredoxin-like copper-binding protein
VTLLFLVPACSDEEAEPTQASSDGHDHSHDFGDADVDDFRFVLGKPGEPAAATRTVSVEALADYRFSPRSLEVKAGETVTFEVTNRDKLEHEFVLGNEQYQELHDTQMRAGGVFHDYSSYSVHVMPGETRSVTWTFERSGRVLFACHVAGHYEEGMLGEIRIS